MMEPDVLDDCPTCGARFGYHCRNEANAIVDWHEERLAINSVPSSVVLAVDKCSEQRERNDFSVFPLCTYKSTVFDDRLPE